jgi:hypothetical protein
MVNVATFCNSLNICKSFTIHFFTVKYSKLLVYHKIARLESKASNRVAGSESVKKYMYSSLTPYIPWNTEMAEIS